MQQLARVLHVIQRADIGVQADDAAVGGTLMLNKKPPLLQLTHFAVAIVTTICDE